MAKIINITADGNFNVISLARGYSSMKIQARSAADIQVRFPGNSEFWTIKSGSSEIFEGVLAAEGLELKAAGGTIIEIMLGFAARNTI